MGCGTAPFGACVAFPVLVVSSILLFAHASLVSDPLPWTTEKLCLESKNDLKPEGRSMVSYRSSFFIYIDPFLGERSWRG